MIATFFLAVIIVAIFWVLRREYLISPVGMHSVLVLGASCVFYIVQVLGFKPDQLETSYITMNDYSLVAPGVLGFYLILAGIGVFVSWRCRPSLPATIDTIRARGKRRVELDASRDSLDLSRLREAMRSGARATVATLSLIFMALFLLSVWHAFEIDWSLVWSHEVYLQIRAPVDAGIDNPVLAMFQTGITVIGCVLAMAVVVLYKQKLWYPAALALICFLYSFTFTLAMISRVAALQVIVMAFAVKMFSTSRKERVAAKVLMFLAFILFYTLIVARDGQNGFGLRAIALTVLSGRLFTLDSFESVALLLPSTSFSGGFVFADVLSRGPYSYLLMYKVLSFSPLPSFLDKFDALLAASENRVLWYVPFGCFAEAYAFGPIWCAGFLVFFTAILFLLQRYWTSASSKNLRMVVLAPALWGMVQMHEYPIRTCMRFFYISVLLAWWVSHRSSPSKSGSQLGSKRGSLAGV